MIQDKDPLKTLKRKSKFPKLMIEKNKHGGESLFLDGKQLPWSVTAYEIAEYIGNATASLTVTMDIDRDYIECSDHKNQEWRRFEMCFGEGPEKEELYQILNRLNLSRRELALIVLGLHVRPGFDLQDFDT